MNNKKRTKFYIVLRNILISFLILIIIFGSFFILLSICFLKKYDKEITEYSIKYNVDKNIIFSLIKAESNFNKNVVSEKGAIGLMQILPKTSIYIAEKLNIQNFNINLLFEPEINLEFGIYYLSYLKNKFNNLDTAICAYNAGETVVRKWLTDKNYSNDGITLTKIPFKETNNYLNKIKIFYKFYKLM